MFLLSCSVAFAQQPIRIVDDFNISATSNVAFISTLTPVPDSVVYRVSIALSGTNSVVNLITAQGSTSFTQNLREDGEALVAGRRYVLSFAASNGRTYRLACATTTTVAEIIVEEVRTAIGVAMSRTSSAAAAAFDVTADRTGTGSWTGASGKSYTTTGAGDLVSGDDLTVADDAIITDLMTSSNVKRGTGTPESAITGSIGDVYQRTDGSTSTTLYIKESGTATNTGWVAVGAASSTGWSKALHASYGISPIGSAVPAPPGMISVQGRMTAGFATAPSTQEALDFETSISESYNSVNTITVEIDWISRTADIGTGGVTTGDVIWDVAVERMTDGALDLDSTGFDTAKATSATTTSGTAGIVVTSSLTLTQAEADDVTAGDLVILRLRRDIDAAGDTMAADANVLAVRLKQ